MEGLQARESHGELEVWKDGSGFHMERGLEGTLGAFSTGRQLGWDRGVCTRAGLWEREAVWAGETPRRPSEPALGLAGRRAGREGEILDKAPGWGG